MAHQPGSSDDNIADGQGRSQDGTPPPSAVLPAKSVRLSFLPNVDCISSSAGNIGGSLASRGACDCSALKSCDACGEAAGKSGVKHPAEVACRHEH